MLRMRTLPTGPIEPCLPTKTDALPSGGLWVHEIKHDAFRIIARKNGAQVRLYSRPGNDLTGRFPLIVETLANLRTRSCIIDGEAVACDCGIVRPGSLSAPRWQGLPVRPCGVNRLMSARPRCGLRLSSA
jgi:ATP-dependent DNA ligase